MDYMTNYEKNIQIKLDRNEKLLRAKTEQIADLQYEAELITNMSIELIRGISDPVQIVDLHQIWLDFDNDKGQFKLDCEDSEEELKFIEENYIFDCKRPEDVKLKELSIYGYCWEFWLNYTCGDKEFRVALPCYKNANKANYKNLYYAIRTVNKYCCTTVFKTKDLSELKDSVTKFLNGEIGNE